MLAIDILKRIAFVKGFADTDYVLQCYGVIREIWDSWRRVLPEEGSPFSPHRMLDGWVADLDLVQPQFLGAYTTLLGCRDVESSACLDDAIVALKRRVSWCNHHGLASHAGGVANYLIQGVLTRWMDVQHSAVLSNLLAAADMAIECAEMSGDLSALARLALLAELLRHRITMRDNGFSKSDEGLVEQGLFRRIYTDIAALYVRCLQNEQVRRELRNLQTALVPALLGHRRAPRRKVTGVQALVVPSAPNVRLTWRGRVLDACSTGQACHVRLEDTEGAIVVTGTRKKLAGTDVGGVTLCVRDARGAELAFGEATLSLQSEGLGSAGAGSAREYRAWPIRGWRYVDSGEAGVVFWIERPHAGFLADLAALAPHEGQAQATDFGEVALSAGTQPPDATTLAGDRRVSCRPTALDEATPRGVENMRVAERRRDTSRHPEEESAEPLEDGPDALLGELARIEPGKPDAAVYQRWVARALELVFEPWLARPEQECKIHEGRKRVDIVFTNQARDGFFWELRDTHWIKCPYVFVECKNFSSDPKNPELDQIQGRLSNRRGMFGIVVCREIEDPDLMLKRCRDIDSDNRGCILVLDDDDMTKLLKLAAKQNFAGISSHLSEKLKHLRLF